MSRLEELIEQVAKQLKFNELTDGGFSLRTELVINVAKLYAEECVKASLEKAHSSCEIKDSNDLIFAFNKDLIIGDQNIILL